jgi:protocatechuate 3,4-dioxygenase alpha subunit
MSGGVIRTPSQTVGPFYAIGLDRRPENALVDPEAPGALRVVGRLIDGAGDPISDGLIELWSATAGAWGRCGTSEDGSFWFVLAKPPAGPGEASRYDVFVHARGLLRHQLTRFYFPDELAANEADPVLSGLPEADRATLVAEQADGGLRFDVRMQGDRQTVFFEH